MNWSDLTLPQVWMVGVVAAILAFKAQRQGWRAPSLLDDGVELVAYFAGLYGTKVVFVEAIKQKEHAEIGVALMVAGALLAFVSIRGVWRTYNRRETVTPTTPPSAPPPPEP